MLYFSKRVQTKEWMDDPHSDQEKLFRTLDQFHFINFIFSRSRRLLQKEFLKGMVMGKEYTWVDLGAGGGDLAFYFWKEVKKRKLNCNVVMVDVDPRIHDYLEKKFDFPKGLFAESKRYPGLFLYKERLESFPKKIDFLFGNHFLHHLSWNEIDKLLTDLNGLVEKKWVFNDLERSILSYIGYYFFGLLFLPKKKSFAFEDGLLSIKRGFLKEDFTKKGWVKFEVKNYLPFRVIVKNSES